MSDVLGAIQSILDAAGQQEQQIRSDRRYTQDFKQEAIQAAWHEAKAKATYLAKDWLKTTHQAAEQAAQALNEAQAKFDAGLDYHRLSYAAVEAQALGQSAKSLPEVERVANQAIATRDYAALRGLARVALPLVKARQQTQQHGQLRDALGGFDSLTTRIEQALSELEPANLRTARQKAAQAAHDHQRAAVELQRINWRHSQMRGGQGPLRLEDAPGITDFSALERQWS